MTQDLSLRSKGEKVKEIYRENFDIWVLPYNFWCFECRNRSQLCEALGLPLSPALLGTPMGRAGSHN